jgi:very-short-patch-repair endonuclease
MSDSDSPAVETPLPTISIDYSERVNFAFQQNAIPVLRRLEIHNNTENDWHNVSCRLNTQPEWAEPHSQDILHIPAGTTYVLTDIPLQLDIDYLTKLSEQVRGEIRVELWGSKKAIEGEGSPESEKISEQAYPVDVYAYDEWTGLRTLPDILAAFVTPNLSVVEQLLSNTAHLLGKRTESSALDGYQANSKKRVYAILDAVFDSIREQSIRYSNPPASFEKTGQRVRFGTQIMQSKLATCLDLTLLFASVIEQAGLNAIILMHKGHSYVGCWLIEDSFSDPATDDLQSIRKRKELEELVVFETTLVCDGKAADFTQAVSAAEAHISLDDIFEYAIDIHRCRSSRIRPLPLDRNDTGVDIQKAHAAHTVVPTRTTRALDKDFRDEIDLSTTEKTPEGRVDHWKQQLLDLTLRNRLLNFKETKQTIPLLCPQPEHIEDELASDQTFKVLEQTPLIAGTDPRSLNLQSQQGDENPIIEHLTRELHAKRLRSSLTEKELSRRLLELYRKVRMENEESGANTLFLALGYLEWKQNRDDDRSYRAPILLVPVKLHRKSVHAGFSLQRHDEDTLINVTLLELLKRDYELEVPGVNPPPEDDSGVDVDGVFRRFQHAVRDMPGWEVHKEVWLAPFSFSKFLLWKDLQDRSEILSKNAVVDHLINNPGAAFYDEIDDLKPDELDAHLGFEQIYCPMSSDSSQLAAILAAANGKNFVMNGPPGTGKSQTITNIIAHCLAEGKRVLFVAEKRAALEVVHHRLSQIGLGPFCLELHSNKSGKAEVLRQFGEAINYVEQKPSDEWQTLADRLNGLRNELNGYVKELHRIYPNRLSAYQCYAWLIAQCEKESSFSDFDQLDIPECEQQSLADYEQLQKICEDLMFRGQERRLPEAAKDALYSITASEWTPDWENSVVTLGKELLQQVKDFRPIWSEVAEKLGLSDIEVTEEVLIAVASLTSELRGAPPLPVGFINESNWTASFKPQAEQWIASGVSRDAAISELEGFNLEALHRLDTASMEANYKEISKDGAIAKFFRFWGFFTPIHKARNPGAPKWDPWTAPVFFENISILKKEQAVLDAAKDVATAHFGTLYWNNGEANWESLSQLLEYGDALHSAVKSLAGDSVDRLIQLRSKIGDLLSAGSEFLQEGGSICELFGNYTVAWSAVSHSKQSLDTLLGVEASTPTTDFLGQTESFCQNLEANKEYLSSWCRWQDAYKQANASGLSPLLEAHRNGALDLDDFRKAFDYAYHSTFLKRLLTLSPTLRDFYGEEHQKRIDAFRDFDERYTNLTGQIVAARLAARLPSARGEECRRDTELGMIQREMVKKRRHKPVRKLLAEAPGIAPHLKPCFLMSPLSVAQYLDAEQTEFDIVVFDEASQIPVWDAIGAIARGKQLIVVGDPKQLPPTNFFSRADSDDGVYTEDQTEDLESILDECRGSGLHVHSLHWHYRSRKEGLIAFSNYHYYGNELHTFPSPHSEDIGVSLVPVPDGYYDKGKSRTNKAEAEAIKKEVIRRLTDPEQSKRSIGIVTFSQAQQTEILDKLDEARREHPEIEPHFDEEADEPVFVKNLENVQGDERDLILFSICYAPDQAGKLSMNFGPLNRDGGERRLNVAVTRAKHEVMIFSTLRSEQIDLSRTKAIGATHLKSYLEYAERGPSAIAANIESARTQDYDSIFEKEVAEFLRNKGYTVHTQIGCSGYRVDLAIVRPDSPGHYLLGIECDGATYHRAATARDRDRLRQAVLEGLGWTIYRIWSTDWWRSSKNAKEDLIAAVDAALAKPIQENTPTEPLIPVQPVEIEAVDQEVSYASNVSAPSANTRKQDYPEITLLPHGPGEDFYEPRSRPVIQVQINRIIEDEGPITAELITRRVAQEWGFKQVGSKIKRTVEDYISQCSAKPTGTTYWPESVEPTEYKNYRIADREIRKFDAVPPEELHNAAFDILDKYISFPEDGLAAEIARSFGFNRVTKSTAEVCEVALKQMLDKQVITLEDGNYKIAN